MDLEDIHSALEDGKPVKFQIKKLENDTFLASIIHHKKHVEEDNFGPFLYVTAVIFIYGFSIILMIISAVRRRHTDLDHYFHGLKKLIGNERKRVKQNMTLLMSNLDNGKKSTADVTLVSTNNGNDVEAGNAPKTSAQNLTGNHTKGLVSCEKPNVIISMASESESNSTLPKNKLLCLPEEKEEDSEDVK